MNQAFTTKELLRQLRENDLRHWKITKDTLQTQLEKTEKEIFAGSFKLNLRKTKNYYLANNIETSLVLRKLNDNIKRIYKEKQANRNLIIDQVKTLLSETTPFYVLRTDIKKFYESINRDKLVEKIKKDSMLEYHSEYILNQLFDDHLLEDTKGLPRGMNISATLAEIYMRKIDRWIIRNRNIYYYARFVDDMIIFFFDKKYREYFLDELENELHSENLQINEGKTKKYSNDMIGGSKSDSIEYLGYKFYFENQEKNKVYLAVAIADKKINKIKTRIVNAILDFLKSRNFSLLRERIKFLTGNFIIRKGNDCSDLKAGIYYSYPYLKDKSVLKKLDIFLRSILNSKKNSFGKKISAALNDDQRRMLMKYSFCFGWENKVTHSFSFQDMENIGKCWL